MKAWAWLDGRTTQGAKNSSVASFAFTAPHMSEQRGDFPRLPLFYQPLEAAGLFDLHQV
jgi:hypothetical protein